MWYPGLGMEIANAGTNLDEICTLCTNFVMHAVCYFASIFLM